MEYWGSIYVLDPNYNAGMEEDNFNFVYDDLNELAKDQTLIEVTIWNINTTYDLVQIANNIFSAGVEAKKNNLNKAIELKII